MRRIIGWTMAWAAVGWLAWALMAAFAVPVAGASTPADTTLSACPSGQGILSATVPAYARQSTGLEVGIGVGDPTRVSDASVSVFSGAELISTTPVTLSASATVATVTAPSTGTTVSVIVTWDQDAGTPAGCSGVDLDEIPLISAYGSAGDPDLPRLAGTFDVIETPVNYRAGATHAQWLFNSACVYFACGSYLQSSGGIELPISLLASGAYAGATTYGPALTGTPCTSRGADPVEIKNAYTLAESVKLTVTASAAGAVSEIAGTLTGTYTPTPAARRQGCRRTYRTIEQVSGEAA